MNKTIFITGASSGIGHSLSLKFSTEGWNVVAAARRINLLRALSKSGKKDLIKPIKIDIINKKSVASGIFSTIKKYGIPDIIFLNAGTNNPNSNHIISLKEVREIFEINFFGTLNCISEFLPYLKKKNKNVQIIIMSSVAGYRGLPYASAYCSSKSAMTTFAEAIYAQCKQLGVHIRVVNPGFIKTPLTDKNDFPMPMIISSEKAANILYKKFISSRSFEISLPWIFCSIMKLLKILPYSIYLRITNLMIKKL